MQEWKTKYITFTQGQNRKLKKCGSVILLEMKEGKAQRKQEVFENNIGTSLVFQWLTLHASSARNMDSIPGQGTRCHRA